MTTDPGSAAFAVERFQWTSPQRLELTGRWTGVRGIRFVRPTLVLVAGDEHRRLLADLDDKPWPAVDGAPWTCAFPWTGDPLDADAAELTVAPGILMRLDAPDLPPDAPRRPREAPPEPAPPDAGPPPAPRPGAPQAPPPAPAAPSTLARVGGARGLLQRAADTERAERELAAERARRLELEQERDALRQANAALQRERDDLLRLRDEAVRTRNVVARERDAAAVVRDRLQREREGLVEARDDLRHERDALRRRLEQLEARD